MKMVPWPENNDKAICKMDIEEGRVVVNEDFSVVPIDDEPSGFQLAIKFPSDIAPDIDMKWDDILNCWVEMDYD